MEWHHLHLGLYWSSTHRSGEKQMGQEEKTDSPTTDQDKKSVDQLREEAKASRRRSQFSQQTLFDMPGQGRAEQVIAAAKSTDESLETLEGLPEVQPAEDRPVPGITRDDSGVVVRVTYLDLSGYELTYTDGEVSDMVLRNRDGKRTAT